jgi:glycine/D-amino acid oxidase-like deaminating enzyme
MRFPPADGAINADAAVIGGGILGFCAALRLAQGGASVVVLEAASIGHGASGRNGGLVVPSLPRASLRTTPSVRSAPRASGSLHWSSPHPARSLP